MKSYDVSREFQGGYTAKRSRTIAIVVHHAGADYAGPTGLDDVRAVAKFHTDPEPNGRGWPGIGYHVCLAEEVNGGSISRYVVGDLDGQRAHVLNRNHELVGVCCLTNFDDTSRYPSGVPSEKWIAALAETILWLKGRYPQAIVWGHQEAATPEGKTGCPGASWPKWKTTLLDRLINPVPAVVETFTHPRVYRVIDPTGANVRKRPDLSRSDNIVGVLDQGDVVATEQIVQGSVYQGSTAWLRLGRDRYAHSKLFELVALPPTQQPDADHVLVSRQELADISAALEKASTALTTLQIEMGVAMVGHKLLETPK